LAGAIARPAGLCLQQLQAEGIDVEIPDQWLENSRVLDTVVWWGPYRFDFYLAKWSCRLRLLATLGREKIWVDLAR
jgi:hypothetical protein